MENREIENRFKKQFIYGVGDFSKPEYDSIFDAQTYYDCTDDVIDFISTEISAAEKRGEERASKIMAACAYDVGLADGEERGKEKARKLVEAVKRGGQQICPACLGAVGCPYSYMECRYRDLQFALKEYEEKSKCK